MIEKRQIHEYERRTSTAVTRDELDGLIDRAVERAFDNAMERLYADIGKGIVKKLLWALLIGAISFFLGHKALGG